MLATPILLALLAATPSTLAKPANGADVIRLMHAQYEGKWYRTATFTQRTVRPGAPDETWYEAISIPGSLRIDIAPLADRKVLLFRNDSIYRYTDGTIDLSRPLVHPLMLLGFDVYGQSPDTTIAALTALGYDLTKLHPDTWQDRKVWVVGATPGDTTSKQFWIDQERLVFVRSIEPAAQHPENRMEVQFNNYVRLGGGWIETEVLQMRNGEVLLKEEYANMQADPAPALDPAIFLAGPYQLPGWVKE